MHHKQNLWNTITTSTIMNLLKSSTCRHILWAGRDDFAKKTNYNENDKIKKIEQ